MNKSEMEKKLAEYLDERYSLLFLNIDTSILARNEIFYNRACAAISISLIGIFTFLMEHIMSMSALTDYNELQLV